MRKLLVARGLAGDNSQEKIVHRRKWLVRDNSYEQIAHRRILDTWRSCMLVGHGSVGQISVGT
jgi:hypothetical protein